MEKNWANNMDKEVDDASLM